MRELTPIEERDRKIRHKFGSAYSVIVNGDLAFLKMLKEKVEELIKHKEDQ